MPRSPTRNRDIRDSRRADILKAAAKLFARHGLTDTKIGDIAQEAGLSHGLVYHYFPSKEAVFEAILADKREALWVDLERIEAEQGVEATLRELLGRSLRDAIERPEMTVMTTQALLTDSVPERLRANLRRTAREAFARSISLLERGQAEGCVEPNVPAEELASAMFCLMRGVFVTAAQAIRGNKWMPMPEADTLFRVLAPRGAAIAPFVAKPIAAKPIAAKPIAAKPIAAKPSEPVAARPALKSKIAKLPTERAKTPSRSKSTRGRTRAAVGGEA